jgi:hypothetical protein
VPYPVFSRFPGIAVGAGVRNRRRDQHYTCHDAVVGGPDNGFPS